LAFNLTIAADFLKPLLHVREPVTRRFVLRIETVTVVTKLNS
jgi:hypothetical protein